MTHAITNATHGVIDSGATRNYLLVNANVTNIQKTVNPIKVYLPDNSTITSTHTGHINWPMVPKEATHSHILPGLKNHSLISVVQLCNAGCRVTFDKDKCTVQYNGRDIVQGTKCHKNGLWYVPLSMEQQHDPHHQQGSPRNPKPNPTNPNPNPNPNQANSIYHTSTMAETIKYLHQCFNSPTVSAFTKAIDNDQLIGLPGQITSDAVRKYLPESTATHKDTCTDAERAFAPPQKKPNQ